MQDFKGASSLIKLFNETDIVNDYKNGNSYFFIGNYGTGKTLTATNIIKKYCFKNYSSLYTTLFDVVSVLLDAPNEEKFSARKELINVDFLVIDEVDSRFAPSENASDLFGRTLEAILRTRIQNKLPTIMCSNSPNPIEMFTGAMKASIDSLCSSMTMVVALSNDFRKTNDKIFDKLNNNTKQIVSIIKTIIKREPISWLNAGCNLYDIMIKIPYVGGSRNFNIAQNKSQIASDSFDKGLRTLVIKDYSCSININDNDVKKLITLLELENRRINKQLFITIDE